MTKNLFLVCLLAILSFSIGTQADNTITIGSASGSPGSTVTVGVSLKNSDAVSAIQVQMPMPDNCTLVDGSAKSTSRTAGHSVTAGVRNDTLNLFVYSPSMATITGNDGDIMTFQLLLGSQPETINLDVSKLIITDASGKKISGTANGGQVVVSSAKAEYSTRNINFGRVPIRSSYDQPLTINNTGNSDLTITAFDFSSTELTSDEELPFTIPANESRTVNIKYSPTKRGKVNERLRVVCNSSSKLNTIEISAEPYAVNELHISDASGIADSTVTVHLNVNNMDAISAFQFEFALPEQLKYVDGSFALSGRKVNHQGVASLNGDTLRLIAYSIDNKPFTGNEGEIASFDLRLKGQYGTTLDAYKALLIADIDGKTENVLSDKFAGNISISSPILNAESSLDLGATPITEDAVGAFSINNYGSAPLTISRIEFDTLNFSIKEQLPLTIEAGGSKNINVVYSGQGQQSFATIMQLYCNDPNNRVWKVNVTGSRFAPNFLSMQAQNICVGDTLNVSVSLNNYDSINGIQFDVDFPQKYFTPAEKVVTTNRASGLSVQVRKLENGVYRYFVYSLSNVSIKPDSGGIFTFRLLPTQNIPVGNYQLKISNIKLGTPEMADKYSRKDFNVPFHVSLNEQNIIWSHNDTTILVGDSCEIEAKSSASLPVSYKLVSGEDLVKATTENGTLKLTALKSGMVKIVASAEADATHEAAADTCTVTINKRLQTINWSQDSSLYVGSTIKLTATASSDSLVTYEITAGSEFAELVNDNDGVSLKALKPGMVTVTARQAGNDMFEAVELSKNFIVLALNQQTITWNRKDTAILVGDSCEVEAKSSASLPVSYKLVSGEDLVKATAGNGTLKLTALKSGMVKIVASAEADATHEAAADTCTVTINKRLQTINWSQDSSLYVGSTIKLTATASSDSLVTYEITAGSEFAELVNDNDGVSLKALKPGMVTVTARQAGNNMFDAAELSKNFTVLALENQTITWVQQTASLNIGDSCILEAVSSADLPITYTITKGSDLVQTYVYEGILHLTALKSGEVSVTATAEGDYAHESATSTIDLTINIVTGINDISTNVSDGNWYTIQGIKLDGEPKTPGVYIHNGRKVLHKR